MAELKSIQISDLVTISENALISIAGIALTEVEGVSTKHSHADGVLDKSEMRHYKKTIKFTEHNQGMVFDISVKIKYGNNIEVVSKNIQETVINAFERNIGVKPHKINVIVTGIEFDK